MVSTVVFIKRGDEKRNTDGRQRDSGKGKAAVKKSKVTRRGCYLYPKKQGWVSIAKDFNMRGSCSPLKLLEKKRRGKPDRLRLRDQPERKGNYM